MLRLYLLNYTISDVGRLNVMIKKLTSIPTIHHIIIVYVLFKNGNTATYIVCVFVFRKGHWI